MNITYVHILTGLTQEIVYLSLLQQLTSLNVEVDY
jgi:hypothetical protein